MVAVGTVTWQGGEARGLAAVPGTRCIELASAHNVYYVKLLMRRIRAMLKAVTAALSAHRQGVSYAEKALAA